jgi:hypothetical protein
MPVRAPMGIAMPNSGRNPVGYGCAGRSCPSTASECGAAPAKPVAHICGACLIAAQEARAYWAGSNLSQLEYVPMNEAERNAGPPPTPQYRYADRVGDRLF